MQTSNVTIPIGTGHGRKITLDVMRLIETRMLIEANSGGGKSNMLRLIVERAAAKVPTIVIDPEGEFYTLRPSIDLVVVGEQGDVPANPKSAKLLARKLLELRVSAVVDVCELRALERSDFIRRFIESLMTAPRRLWSPTLIMVDEASTYCPERSAGQSQSTDAVIDLMTRGRKRGFGGVIATQRLSRLRKDAAAECRNVLIGLTNHLDDQKRAAELLGIGSEARRSLSKLREGQFHGFGPALSCEAVELMQIAKAKTKPPGIGKAGRLATPGPSQRIQRYLPDFADLAERSHQEAHDLETARAEIRELRRQVAGKDPVVDQSAIERAVAQAVQECQRVHHTQVSGRDNLIRQFHQGVESIAAAVHKVAQLNGQIDAEAVPAVPISRPGGNPRHRVVGPESQRPESEASFGKCERAILTVLAQHPNGCSKAKLTLLSGYRWTGGFSNALSTLRTAGLLVGRNTETMRLSEAGRAMAGTESLPTGEQLREYWRQHPSLGKCGRAILGEVMRIYPAGIGRDELCDAISYRWTGGFSNALSKLRTIGLLAGGNTEEMKASDLLFEVPA